MKRSGLAKNSGCLAFLNPGDRLADLISEILEAQDLFVCLDPSTRFPFFAPSLPPRRLANSFPRRTSRIRGHHFPNT